MVTANAAIPGLTARLWSAGAFAREKVIHVCRIQCRRRVAVFGRRAGHCGAEPGANGFAIRNRSGGDWAHRGCRLACTSCRGSAHVAAVCKQVWMIRRTVRVTFVTNPENAYDSNCPNQNERRARAGLPCSRPRVSDVRRLTLAQPGQRRRHGRFGSALAHNNRCVQHDLGGRYGNSWVDDRSPRK